MKKTAFLFLLLSCAPALAQLVTPVLTPAVGSGPGPAGSFYNSVSVTAGNLASLNQSVTYCGRVDGGTPTATVAGTCDGLPTFALDNWAYLGATGTVCLIATKVASTNSAAACGTYTVTPLSQPNPLVSYNPVLTKITNASGTITNGNPVVIVFDASHWSLFYSQCPSGATDQSGAVCDVLLKTTANAGVSWTDWPTTTNCAEGSPPTGCFLHTNAAWLDLPTGMLIDAANGVGIVFGAEWNGVNNGTRNGAWFSRTTDAGAHWTTPSFITAGQAQGFWINPTGTGQAIPANSPGVTGSCAPGCYIMNVLGTDTQHLVFSFDQGQTWTTTTTIPLSFQAEEGALAWHGGNNLSWLVRSGSIAYPSGPVSAQFSTSSDMGTTWSGLTWPSSQHTAIPSNLPFTSCSTYPNMGETFARVSMVVSPQDSTKARYLWGKRWTCNGQAIYGLETVEVSLSSIFNSGGYTFPQPTILGVYGTQTASANSTMPHTVYNSMAVLDSSRILVVVEKGQGGNSGVGNEDIYSTILTYYTPQAPQPSPALFAKNTK